MVRIRIRIKWTDPDPYQIEKQDPDLYKSEKQDPKPHKKGLYPQHWPICRISNYWWTAAKSASESAGTSSERVGSILKMICIKVISPCIFVSDHTLYMYE